MIEAVELECDIWRHHVMGRRQVLVRIRVRSASSSVALHSTRHSAAPPTTGQLPPHIAKPTQHVPALDVSQTSLRRIDDNLAFNALGNVEPAEGDASQVRCG